MLDIFLQNMHFSKNSLLSWASPLITNSVRCIRHKPWIPKFKLIRQMQPWIAPFDPDQIFMGGKFGAERTSSEIREELRRNGLLPPLIFQDRPLNLTHSGRIFDEYVPPEGDGKSSLLSKDVIAEKKDLLLKKSKSLLALRKVTKHQPTFNSSRFPLEADSIYKEVHTLLPRFYDNETRLLELVTEKAFTEMTDGLRLRTLEWKFGESLERPSVVSIRTEEFMGKDNLFAQVTLKFHTRQMLAVYDRFGRLLYGNPTCPVDVLEYVVFENHISDVYCQWRIHGKIVPPWAKTPVSSFRTFKLLSDEASSDSDDTDPAVPQNSNK